MPADPSRREALLRLGGAGVLAVVAACPPVTGDDDDSADDDDDSADDDDSGDDDTGDDDTGDDDDDTTLSCVLAPAQTAGPFYFDPGMVRQDITEGMSGSVTRQRVIVVDAETCEPIRDAVVDLWHADPRGAYSGYGNQGDGGALNTTGEGWLRGLQVTDAKGAAEFISVYPGWYPGRSIHSHLKVHLDASTLVTTQVYFPDEVTAVVMTEDAYAARGEVDTTNTEDGIFNSISPDLRPVFRVETVGEERVATVVIGVATG